MNMGTPKRASRFLCIKHMGENFLGAGIQRGKRQREKYHIKDLYCPICGSIEKCIEIRWCDTYEDVYNKAMKIREEYYIEESECDEYGTNKRLCN